MSPILFKKIQNNLQEYDNVFQDKGYRLTDKIILINQGIGRTTGTMKIDDIHNAGGSIFTSGNVTINVSYIDKEVKEKNLNLKFIKADVEGAGLQILQGAKKTIELLRPVISIAIYHNFDEFFEICEFMKQFPNYIWEFHLENEKPISFYEISAFFYPAEIRYDVYPH